MANQSRRRREAPSRSDLPQAYKTRVRPSLTSTASLLSPYLLANSAGQVENYYAKCQVAKGQWIATRREPMTGGATRTSRASSCSLHRIAVFARTVTPAGLGAGVLLCIMKTPTCTASLGQFCLAQCVKKHISTDDETGNSKHMMTIFFSSKANARKIAQVRCKHSVPGGA